MPSRKARLRNTSITIITFAVLGMAAFGYFYLYIQQREAALEARHYRVLNQIRQNILSLNDTYLKNAGSNAAKDLQGLRNQATVMYNDKIQENNEKLNREIDAVLKSYPWIVAPKDRDTLKKFLQEKFLLRPITNEDVSLESGGFKVDEDKLKQSCANNPRVQDFKLDTTYLSITNCKTLSIRKNVPKIDFEFYSTITVKPEISFEEFASYYKQKINLNYVLQEYDKDSTGVKRSGLRKRGDTWELVYAGTILPDDNENRKPHKFEMTRPVNDLMSKVLREDVFDEFVVYCVSNDTTSKGEKKYTSIFQTFEENFFSKQLATKMDSLMMRQLDQENRNTIKGVPFRIYLQPLHLLDGESLFVCGLVDLGRFESEKARIPPLIILFIGLAILMVLLAYPSLKLLLMSRYESLSVSDLFLSLISIIMGTSMVVLMMFNGYRVFFEDEKQRKLELEAFHEEISNTLFAELGAIHKQLKYYDKLKRQPPGLNFEKGAIMRVLSQPKDSSLYPKDYPYFNALLWATPSLQIGDEITPRETPTPNIDIAGRQYLESFRSNQAWELPASTGQGQFMLESILTRTTGDQLAVVSTESQTQAPIIFLSTYLNSVINTVMPLGYGYCILNQDGLVLFHSDPSRNLQENFLEECNIKDLQSTMYSRAALHTEGNYLGEDHNFYLKPLDQLPLFLITFENKRFYRMAHAQTISLNFLFALGFLLFVLLFLGLLHVFRPDNNTLRHSSYILDWMRPTQLNTNKYRKLFLINLTILLLLIFVSRTADDFTSIMLILGGNFYAFVLAFFHLNRNSYKEFNWSRYWHISVALGLIFGLFNTISVILPGININKVLIFEIPLLLITFLALEGLIAKSVLGKSYFKMLAAQLSMLLTGEDSPNGFQKAMGSIQKGWERWLNNRRSYRFFLLSWLFISSIFPALKFYQISYDYERKLLTQLMHIQLDKDLQERNLWIDNLYRGLDPGAAFLTDLKHKGIYTQPYLNTSFDTIADQNAHLEITLFALDDTLWVDTSQREVSLYHDSLEIMKVPIRFAGKTGAPSPALIMDSLRLKQDTTEILVIDGKAFQVDDNLVIQGMVEPSSLETWLVSDSLNVIQIQEKLYHQSNHLQYDLDASERDTIWGTAVIKIDFQIRPPIPEAKDKSSLSLASILAIFRPRFSEAVRQTNQVNYDRSANELWYWCSKPNENRLQYFNKKEQYSISSTLPKYAFPTPAKRDGLGFLFWTIFAAGIFALYKLLNFHINRLFAQDVINLEKTAAHSNKELLLQTKENVFLVVPPPPIVSDFFDVLQWKINQYPGSTNELEILDMRDLPVTIENEMPIIKDIPKLDSDKPVLVLNHFDDQIEKNPVFKARIKLLAQLRQQYAGKQIIIISTLSQITPPDVKDAAVQENPNGLEVSFDQFWEETMSGFIKIIYPVERWIRLNTSEELLDFTALRPSFMQITPAKMKDGMLVKDHGFGALELKKPRQLPFKYYAHKKEEDGKVLATNLFILISHEDQVDSLLQKIEFIESRIEKEESVHVLSTIPPVELLKTCDGANEIERQTKEQWKRFLYNLQKGFVQINDFRANQSEKAQNRIIKECVYSRYLQNIQQELMEQLGDGLTSEMNIILEVETRAQLYYQALWNSFTIQEQYIIYDVANDGIVNSKNRLVFTRLMEKGLIVIRGDNPRMMSRSFRNFVLTKMEPQDLAKLNKEVKEDNTWGQARVLIAAVILALGAFIFTTQGDLIDSTLAFFTGLAAFVPFLREVFTNISVPETKLPNFFPKNWGNKK